MSFFQQSKHQKNAIKRIRKAIALTAWQLIFIPVNFVFANTSASSVNVGSYSTPGLIHEDGTGLFNQLNNAVFKEMGQDHHLIISSLNRARKGIQNGTLNVYFPELWENLAGDKSQYVVSRPIFYKRIILFTLKNSEMDELSDFEEGILGGVRGFSYGASIKSNASLNMTYQANDSVNVKLLLNERIGGVLGGYPGTVQAVKANDTDNLIHYDLNEPVAVLESFYVCTNDLEGVKLCSDIDKAIESLLSKGILELNSVTGRSRFNPVQFQ